MIYTYLCAQCDIDRPPKVNQGWSGETGSQPQPYRTPLG